MEVENVTRCACCQYNIESQASFCDQCGYPLQGTKEQQAHHMANRSIKEIDLLELNKKVEKATASLYWIAGLLTISTLFYLFINSDNEEFDIFGFLITSVILVAAFLSFAVWSKTKPTAALISGLSLYVIIQILNAVEQPSSLFSGIIIKIFIIAYLSKGILAVLEVEKIKKELNIK